MRTVGGTRNKQGRRLHTRAFSPAVANVHLLTFLFNTFSLPAWTRWREAGPLSVSSFDRASEVWQKGPPPPEVSDLFADSRIDLGPPTFFSVLS